MGPGQGGRGEALWRFDGGLMKVYRRSNEGLMEVQGRSSGGPAEARTGQGIPGQATLGEEERGQSSYLSPV